jgi:dihydroxyacetone kinase-like protein
VVSESGAAALLAAFDRVLRRTEQAQQDLDRLDAVAGDGDAGVTMVLGWRTVISDLAAARPATPGAVLKQAAESFASVGGSSGPLWGTALLRAGRALEDVSGIDAAGAARAAAAAAAGVAERGRCAEGEKTMLDVMAPAARALERAAARGASLEDALDEAAREAASACEQTASLTPAHGRAARAAERSRGHADPGAAAAAVFWAAIADAADPITGGVE